MFDDSIVKGASDGLDLLERIIDIIMKIFKSLFGGASDTTTEAETAEA